MKYFDENIQALITMLEYDMWLVAPDKHIDCVCKNFTTKQGDPSCPKCLGTGYKIRVKKIKGVRQPTVTLSAQLPVKTETGVFFFKVDYKIKDDDLIVWNNEIEQVVKTERHCSDAQKPVYYRCETIPKKSDNNIFLKTLYKGIGKPIRKPNR